MTKKFGFTLAEVLITLAIIGVVATMTIPTLIANYNQKSWDTATSVFNRRLGEALKIMNVSGTLANHDTTAEFVEELSKHIKIVKTCDKGSLDDCFVSEIANTGDKPIETSKLQSAKNLNSTADPEYGTDTMGVMFADGTSALIAYNKNTPQDPYSNKIVELTRGDDGKSVGLSTKAVSILYDVNGLKSPNQMDSGKDIRGINVAIKTGAPIKVIGTDYTAVDCSNAGASNDDYKYCAPTPSGYSDDYWAGAKKACAEQGMSLPETGSYNTSTYYCNSDAAENTLCGLYNNREALGLPSSVWFWSASEVGTSRAWAVNFGYGNVIPTTKTNQYSVVCVGN